MTGGRAAGPIDRDAIGRDLAVTLSDLVAIDSRSPPGDTAAIAARIARDLVASGYQVDTPRFGTSTNVVARLGSGHPSLVFNVHVDTIGPGDRAAWHTEPYGLVVREGRLHGLGASNAKGAAACHLWLAREIARAGGRPGVRWCLPLSAMRKTSALTGLPDCAPKGWCVPTCWWSVPRLKIR